jgi:16S rRNA processing protein RimM
LSKKEKRYLELGVIVGTHGLKGGLRFKSFAPNSDILAKGSEIVLKNSHGSVQGFSLRRVQSLATKHPVVFLDGIENREQAQRLRGAVLQMEVQEVRNAKHLKEGEYLFQELVGLDVFEEGGSLVGQIKGVFSLAGDDADEDLRSKAVLVVKELDDPEKELMIPFHDSWIQKVDLQARQVWVKTLLNLRED